MNIHSVPLRFTNWREDDDGILRVTAYVLKEGVYPYSAKETPEFLVNGESETVYQYIPKTSFTDNALATLEGKPVTIPCLEKGQKWHQWRNTENTLADGLTVGVVAGSPTVTDEGCISCDMLIFDKKAIEAIKNKQLVEVSAGYDGTLHTKDGEFNGEAFQAVQKSLRFNHILLLPDGMGRCGFAVRIINSGNAPCVIGKGDSMNFAEKNSVKEQSVNEDNGQRLLHSTANSDQEQALVQEKENNNDEVTTLAKTLAELAAKLKKAEKRIHELEAPETQALLLQEAIDHSVKEEAVIEMTNEDPNTPETITSEIEAALTNCITLAQRRTAIVTRLMNAHDDSAEGWNQDHIDGAFQILAAKAIKKVSHKPVRVLNGKKSTVVVDNNYQSARERMLKPMQFRNTQNR